MQYQRKTVLAAILILLISFATQRTAAQSCIHSHLSKKFNFRTYAKHSMSGDGFDETVVTLVVTDKVTKKETQRINFKPARVFERAFTDCTEVQSYTTGYNTERENGDSDYGDLIVLDVNFDGRDDLAIKSEEGSNSGSYYSYYVQDSTGKFRINKYLSTQMGFFPAEMNAKKKTLTIIVHANVSAIGKITYKLDTVTQRWRKISSKTISIQ